MRQYEDGDIFGDGVNIAARLEALAEPGGICISARVQEDAAGKLDLSFVDKGEQTLKNIARPVHVYAINASGGSVAVEPLRGSARRSARQLRVIIAASIAVLVGIGIVGWWVWPYRNSAAVALKTSPAVSPQTTPVIASTTAPRLSIVVLPFRNLSNDPEQEYFADGITDDLTTDLSRISGSFVIAHATSLTYKGKPVDAKQVGRELGVRYVLEGSVRRLAIRSK